LDPLLPDENYNLSLSEQDLTELSSDLHLKAMKSNCINVTTFWVQIREEYPALSKKTLKYFFLFVQPTCVKLHFLVLVL
jgi:hypothetical protein